METSKIRIGTGAKGGTIRVWMDGTPEEIVEKLSNRFRVYTTRPTTKAEAKVAKPTATRTTKTTKATRTVETPAAEETATA